MLIWCTWANAKVRDVVAIVKVWIELCTLLSLPYMKRTASDKTSAGWKWYSILDQEKLFKSLLNRIFSFYMHGRSQDFVKGVWTSRDKVDVTWQWWRHKDHSLFVSSFIAHTYMYVASKRRQFTILKVNFAPARIRSTYMYLFIYYLLIHFTISNIRHNKQKKFKTRVGWWTYTKCWWSQNRTNWGIC